MPSTLYDLFWVFPAPLEQRRNPVQMRQPNTIAPPSVGIPAMILYPALLTPAILVGQDKLELILAFNKDDLSKLKASGESAKETAAIKRLINRHLKVQRNLSPRKSYTPGVLFGAQDWPRKIQIERFDRAMTDRLRTKSEKFSGFLHQTAIDLYQKNSVKFDQLYLVTLDAEVLQSARRPGKNLHKHKINNGKIDVPKKIKKWDAVDQDVIVYNAVKVDFDDFNKDFGGQYGFKVQDEDVRVGEVDWTNPIQSYHPVFHFQQLDYANVGHMADIHINSRQQILCRSKAKVINHDDIKTVGEMMNICSLDAKELFDQFGADADIDVVIIGGDLVDFIHNAIVKDLDGSPKPGEVWDRVDMEGRKNYKDNVDFLAFYSLVVDFYQTYGKPAYVVTGNHDQYYEPYGISPRVQMPWGDRKANEGIPWDHNLTIYEAVLSFGPTYGKLLTGVNTSGRPESSFWREKVAWFYQVLTPFSDFHLELPHQHLVALGWGPNENLLSFFTKRDQGIGHLPRADEAMSDQQYGLLSDVTGKNDGKKIILTTHFTFVSYLEAISNSDALSRTWGDSNNQGDVYYTAAWYSSRDFSKADMGTFHKHREDMYIKQFGALENNQDPAKRKIQVVLTGHSHRRALYTIRRDDQSGNNSVKTGFHDFPVFRNGKPYQVLAHNGCVYPIVAQDQLEPWVILSDSGGSIPRVNLAGEFHGWGSDPPAGTKVAFDPALGGAVRCIEAVRVAHNRAKPRFAVAMDYMDVMAKKVINKFESARFLEDDQFADNWRYSFTLELVDEMYDAAKYGLRLDSMKLYYPGSRGVCDLTFQSNGPGNIQWTLTASGSKEFRRRASRAPKRKLFLALTFGSTAPHLQRYDFSTPWTFEVTLDRSKRPHSLTQWEYFFSLERNEDWREIPDLATRKAEPGFA